MHTCTLTYTRGTFTGNLLRCIDLGKGTSSMEKRADGVKCQSGSSFRLRSNNTPIHARLHRQILCDARFVVYLNRCLSLSVVLLYFVLFLSSFSPAKAELSWAYQRPKTRALVVQAKNQDAVDPVAHLHATSTNSGSRWRLKYGWFVERGSTSSASHSSTKYPEIPPACYISCWHS